MELSSFLTTFGNKAREWHKKIAAKEQAKESQKLHEICGEVSNLDQFSLKIRPIKIGGNDIRKCYVSNSGDLLLLENTTIAYMAMAKKYLLSNFYKVGDVPLICGTIAPDGNTLAIGDFSNNIAFFLGDSVDPLIVAYENGSMSDIILMNSLECIAGSGDNLCHLWDLTNLSESTVSTYKPTKIFISGEQGLLSIDHNKNNKNDFLVSYSSGGIKLFDVRCDKFQKSISSVNPPLLLKYFPDYKSFFSFNLNGGLSHIDISSGRTMWNLEINPKETKQAAIECTTSGRLLLFESEKGGSVSVYDVCKDEIIAETEQKKESFTCLTRSADGNIVYACVRRPYIMGIY